MIKGIARRRAVLKVSRVLKVLKFFKVLIVRTTTPWVLKDNSMLWLELSYRDSSDDVCSHLSCKVSRYVYEYRSLMLI